jgi:hypothetical protein
LASFRVFLCRACAVTPRLIRAMVQSSLEIGQHSIQTAGVFGANMVRLTKITLAFGRFLSEDVATVGVAALVFSGCRLTEALGGRPVGLDFILGH